MILPALIDYYDRLAADTQEDVAPRGCSRQPISFCVLLTDHGEFLEIADARETDTTRKGQLRQVPRSLVVLGQTKSSGRGLNPCFLWDRVGYLLGWSDDNTKSARALQTFEEFRKVHLAAEREIDDKAFSAVCRFLETWDPHEFTPDAPMAEYLTHAGVFRIVDSQEYVHERKAVRHWFLQREEEQSGVEKEDTILIPSLVDGHACQVARLHEPGIKNVDKARAGAKLVSFDKQAFCHYGKSQGANAPVAERDAFKYCTALNRLLADPGRRAQIGDMTVVWWADAPPGSDEGDEAEALFAQMFAAPPSAAKDAEDKAALDRLAAAVDRISRGLMPVGLTGLERGFHVLGLSPNAARLSVRLWWNGTLGQMLENIAQHQADAALEPVPPRDEHRPLSVWRMVRETARVHGDRPDMDTLSPILAGELTRAVLSGGLYPRSLLDAIVRRVRTEGLVSHARASITKACITRRRRVLAGRGGLAEEVPVSLNKDGPQAYQLGRLFAVLEKTQEDAFAGETGRSTLNTTLKDRYFGSASSTPASVFPRLTRLHQHHIKKLRSDKPGLAQTREMLVQEIVSHFGSEAFPAHMTLEKQGLFQIGYYHQLRDFYTPKHAGQDDNDNHTADQAGEE